jgi:hypothetical protein
MVEAIAFYKDEMMPKIAEIQRLKYKTDYIDFKPVSETKESTDLYVLVQRKNSLASLEFNFFSEDKLISNVKGVYEASASANASATASANASATASARTMKNRGTLEKSKNGTRKNRPLVELVEEEEEENKEENKEENEKSVVAPVIDVDVDIEPAVNTEDTYRKEYDYIFSQLSPKYQKILSEDKDWLRKTINSFIEFNKLKNAKKTRSDATREFVHPDGLLLPPTQISEGRYDYGHPIYNQILNPDNKIMEPLQIKLLHTYLEPEKVVNVPGQEPSKQYEQYLSTLASLISSVVGFTKF